MNNITTKPSHTRQDTAKAKPLIMTRLRNETRIQHVRIEQSPQLRRLFDDDYALQEYRNLLIKLYGFYQAIENALFADDWLVRQPALVQRQKSGLLIRDLQALALNHQTITQLPKCAALPQIDNLAQRMGALYVLEGATLGGQFIRQRLLQHFGFQILPALNFYSGYHEKTGAQWRIFGRLMTDYYTTGLLIPSDDIVVAACETFQAMTDWLEK